MWRAAKAKLIGKLIALNVYIREEKYLKFKNLSFYLRKLEKGKQFKPKESRRKEKLEKKSMKLKTGNQ